MQQIAGEDRQAAMGAVASPSPLLVLLIVPVCFFISTSLELEARACKREVRAPPPEQGQTPASPEARIQRDKAPMERTELWKPRSIPATTTAAGIERGNHQIGNSSRHQLELIETGLARSALFSFTPPWSCWRRRRLRPPDAAREVRKPPRRHSARPRHNADDYHKGKT